MRLEFTLEENRRNADPDVSERLALTLQGKIYVINPRSAVHHFQLTQKAAVAHFQEIFPLLQLRAIGCGIGVHNGASVHIRNGSLRDGWGIPDHCL